MPAFGQGATDDLDHGGGCCGHGRPLHMSAISCQEGVSRPLFFRVSSRRRAKRVARVPGRNR
ncbi:hypothetical protein Salmuc_02918 [Salipiger mucosus DSM 16094]|uniref:Uncharacterized protein n=1 Tax=Salipiger mucosus DSM 16094 TaxID=1123237 RepID=S9R4M8_9RHOB|nr:hypothetical protein Salmuc_02918 [Salipiger mucosus DSM 16094]